MKEGRVDLKDQSASQSLNCRIYNSVGNYSCRGNVNNSGYYDLKVPPCEDDKFNIWTNRDSVGARRISVSALARRLCVIQFLVRVPHCRLFSAECDSVPFKRKQWVISAVQHSSGIQGFKMQCKSLCLA